MSKHSQSDLIYARACEVIPGGVNTSLRRVLPHLVFSKASGSKITDVDDNEYIDYQAAFGPIVLGHNFEPVSRAVAEAIESIDLLGTGTIELEVKLAEKICFHIPSAEKILFCNSGSEATFAALRLSRAVTEREKIIKFQGCYHGGADELAMNVISPANKIGKKDPLSAGSLQSTIDRTLICEFNDLESVERTLVQNKGEVAAIIVEPIAHNIGCVLPKPGFLEGLREISRHHGIILIFDEIITGFRHDIGGYQRVCGVTPDLTTLGKAMANGYPISAICGKRELMDNFNTHPNGKVFFAGTFNGHAIGCSAALATIETMEKQNVHKHLFRLGDKVRAGLRDICVRLKLQATVAGFGSVFLTYFMNPPIDNYSDLLRNDQKFFIDYRRQLVERGIFKLPLNLKRNHISFSHTDADIENTLTAVDDVLTKSVSHPVTVTVPG
jgi:glutamate-1-semialdehyde 2,1-aminomutase